MSQGTGRPSGPPVVDFSTNYVRRIVDDELDELLPQLPAVLLDGPKGVGRTETDLQRAESVWRLDDASQLAIIAADPAIVATERPPVLVDEWQRHPAVWDVVKRAVPLPAWLPGLNHLKRLTKAPKHHLADPGLAVSLLGLDAKALLTGSAGEVTLPRDGVLLGGLFESLAAMSVRVFAQHGEAKVSHLRTYGGEREVDLIVDTGRGDVIAIEVKLSTTIDDADVRHLNWLEGQIGDRLLDKVVLTTGPRAYRRRDGVAVVPLALLGA